MEEEKAGKSLEYDFETIHNIDIYGCELAPMTKQGLRSWNMTVQYWLASCIHKRVPGSFKAHRLENALCILLIFMILFFFLNSLCSPILPLSIKRNDAFTKNDQVYVYTPDLSTYKGPKFLCRYKQKSM